ncbi:MAG: alpha/beta hydrolase [Roseibium sp.]|nr:alpha/beta hydrolase [Roseibium sp.]
MTPLVLIPGMMCDARLFGPQINTFSGTRPIHLAPICGRDNVSALAADVLEKAPPRFALAGLSMGGIIAMEILHQAPERVERLCLMDTNPLAERGEVKARREPQIDQVRAGHLRAVMRDELKPNYLADGPNKQSVLDLCMDMALGLGPDVFERQLRALQTRPDQQETLKTVSVPTLILMGDQDLLCPRDRHELMHKLIASSSFQIIAEAGHLPTLEQPEAVNAAFEAWFAMS